ncbi:MAG: M20/M25/M40 family metallo-hydrolase [Candidatus Helarchaeota archaeon]|nr:M20/M25/M40 family metallo-hydrolase [Candidatus Helarchaeota archaeon]
MPLKAGEDYTEYMFNFIDDVCKNIGPRLATKPEEHQCIEIIGKELEKYSDETFTQEFRTSYLAYPRGEMRWAVGLILIGLFFIFTIIPWVYIILCSLGLFFFLSEFIFLKEYLDIFYDKGISKNIFGRIKSRSGEPKKYLIFGGHSDSAIDLPMARKGIPTLVRRIYIAIGFAILVLIWSIVKTIVPGALGNVINHPFFNFTILDFVFLVPFIPYLAYFVITLLFQMFGSEIVQGANDNLSGCAVALAIAKYLSQEENRPKNIEVICGSFGAEEAGQRGSKAFVRQTSKEILDNCYMVATESCGGGNAAGILDGELMYMMVTRKFPFIKPIRHDPEVYERLYEGYKRCKKKMKGLPPTEIVTATFAGTDAMRFTEKGIPACAIVGGNFETLFIKNWHSPEDIPENIDKHIMNHILNICLEFIELVDKEYE